MDDLEFEQTVKPFLARQIDSVVQLEVLLLVADRKPRSFSADQIARELRIDPAWADGQLALLSERGLLARSTAIEAAYEYAPASNEIRDAVTALSRAYADRRVSVISEIYSKPPPPSAADPLKSFSDAFRIRKDTTNG